MSIIKRTKANFGIVPREAMERNDISLKAKGLLAYLLCLPDDWQIYIEHLSSVMKEGREAIAGAINELREAGYIVRHMKKDENGRFAGYDYTVHDTAIVGNTESGKSDYGKPVIGKAGTTNIDNTKKEDTTLSLGESDFLQKAVEANRANLSPYESLKALPMPDHLQGVKPHFARWLDDQQERGKKVTRGQAEIALKNLGMMCSTDAEAINSIEYSIVNGYTKFYNDAKAGGKHESLSGGISKQKGDARGGHKVPQTEKYIFD